MLASKMKGRVMMSMWKKKIQTGSPGTSIPESNFSLVTPN
jgi:hypothetical protein